MKKLFSITEALAQAETANGAMSQYRTPACCAASMVSCAVGRRSPDRDYPARSAEADRSDIGRASQQGCALGHRGEGICCHLDRTLSKVRDCFENMVGILDEPRQLSRQIDR